MISGGKKKEPQDFYTEGKYLQVLTIRRISIGGGDLFLLQHWKPVSGRFQVRNLALHGGDGKDNRQNTTRNMEKKKRKSWDAFLQRRSIFERGGLPKTGMRHLASRVSEDDAAVSRELLSTHGIEVDTAGSMDLMHMRLTTRVWGRGNVRN